MIGVPEEKAGGGWVACPVSYAFGTSVKPGSPFTVSDSDGPVDKIELGVFHFVYDQTHGIDKPEGPVVFVVATLRKDGSIVFEFSNTDPSATNPENPYKVTVTLTAEVQDDSDLPSTTSSESYAFRFDPETGISYESTVTTTVKVKTTTIKWYVTDIKKGAAWTD